MLLNRIKEGNLEGREKQQPGKTEESEKGKEAKSGKMK